METKPRHIHFIAICGVGMAPMAVMLRDAGYHVTGSDIATYPPMGDMLRQAGIDVHARLRREEPRAAPRPRRGRQRGVAQQPRGPGRRGPRHREDVVPRRARPLLPRPRRPLAGRGRHPRQDHHHRHARALPRDGGRRSRLPRRRPRARPRQARRGRRRRVLRRRGRRVRHGLLRQGPQVPPLQAVGGHPDERRVRPRRHLHRRRAREVLVPQARRHHPAERPAGRLRRLPAPARGHRQGRQLPLRSLRHAARPTAGSRARSASGPEGSQLRTVLEGPPRHQR